MKLCPEFYLKAYLQCTEPFREKLDGSLVISLFLGKNSQHRPVCAKTISSWVSKVLYIAKAHISPGSIQGAAASACLVTGISLVFLHQQDTFPPTTLLQIGTRILCSMLYWASVSRHSPGKCQTLSLY